MGIQVLIVDDSATMRLVITKALGLTKLDFSVCFEAAHGQEALEILSREWVDVIFTDVHMPVMDGIQLLMHLGKDETLCRIPVIIITVEGRTAMIENALALGARAHIKKPFRPETLRRVLDDVLGTEYARATDKVIDGSDF
jgi:two-component system chemotaxis response regulator CheY